MGRGAVARQGQRKGDFLAGKYLLEDCLGIGGMGEVYRATNVSLGRKVAIKLLSPEYVHIEEDVLRFLREARAAAAIRHTNVVDVFDVARDDDGTPFIVQELLAGEDLEKYLRTRGRLSAEEALEIMIPVADAVAAAHTEKVVHRDLKPANIFLARDRNKITPKVLDFGACLFPTIAARTAKEIRMLIGTPHYMAPEQIVSKAEVDERSDVWALGVILYEMIVGETPFEAETANAVMELVKTRDVPPLRERAKDAPVDLAALIASCTKRDRLARLPDAGAVHMQMLKLRARMRGPSSSRMETLAEMPAQRPEPVSQTKATPQAAPLKGWSAPMRIPSLSEPGESAPSAGHAPARAPRVPSLDRPLDELDDSLDAGLNLPSRSRGGLLTLNSPTSEPPAPVDPLDLDIPFPSPKEAKPKAPPPSTKHPLDFPPPAVVHVPPPPPSQRGGALDPAGPRVLDPDESDDPDRLLALDGRPSSWPPTRERSPPPSSTRKPQSSMPPVLDPRSAASASPIPSSPPPRDLSDLLDPAPASQARPAASTPEVTKAVGPPVVAAKGSLRGKGWSSKETAKFVAAVALPAIAGFIAVLLVPALGTPVGRALRGDSTFASGVLAVVTLVAATALCARSILGERSRWLYVAAGASVLFGIVMIIVTFAASEAAELGVPSSMAGLSTVIAPIAPLALALGALGRARVAWIDPYSRGEAIRFAAIASLMLFLTLVLSPMGAVRTLSRPQQPTTRSG